MSTSEADVSIDAEMLRSALAVANIPCLVPLLYQLTGDRKWLADPYRPTRAKGTDDHDDGGLPDDVQLEIRRATHDAVMAWAAGRPIAAPAPSGDDLLGLASLCVAEEVPVEYEPLAAEQLEFRPSALASKTACREVDLSVVVIGAGISGMTASKYLTDLGVPHTVIEKNPRVGGTWIENRYPGCGVDTPSYLYQLSYYPRAWSQYFGKRQELDDYLTELADHFDLHRSIRFSTVVERLTWEEGAKRWRIEVRNPDGSHETLVAQVVISAAGQLNIPQVPRLDGVEKFTGPLFHSARWPADLDLTGKRVAVVGTGASAMQIVPAIADSVAKLDVYQRSPQWIMPNPNYFRAVSPQVHWLMANVPFYSAWYRFRLAWMFMDRIHASLQRDPNWPHPERSLNAVNDSHRRMLTKYIESELEGRPDLVEKALPTYPPFGKRMLQDNGWYRTLRKPQVELITSGVTALTETGVVTERDEERPADIVVFATGFRAHAPIGYDVVGRNGARLSDVWGEDDPRAYLGIATPGFPNLFFMYGPNSNLGHGGSFIFLAESQINYIVDLLTQMIDNDVAAVDCRPEVCDKYNADLDAAHERMVWTHEGMDTWYRNSRGRVVSVMPWRVVDYWTMTRSADLNDYLVD
ncbi:NAD(P)/FAD-dependent oxidoreductase [Sporichthya brevicatena]|uniref:NAD(P)/FAD-dependent oxidoreductase n=1 Tax=Sporichthya brevicatena TaxID=171442 RepID=A0ABN1GIM1_9ACTN